MNDFYEWLFMNFAVHRVKEDDFSSIYKSLKQDRIRLQENMSQADRMLFDDIIECTKDSWGMHFFVCGVQVGMSILDGFLDKAELMEKFSFPGTC